MNIRTFAFMIRSLRQEFRLLSHHLLRAVMATVILCVFLVALLESLTHVGAGGGFATSVLYCCYVFLTFIGGIYFSTCIVEEKEDQTLPLLRMTGASAFTILAGKSIPRLAVAVMFVTVAAPFLLLSITLGGVLPWSLFTAILSLLIYSTMLCQAGMLASVLCRNASRAFTLTLLIWVTVEFGGWGFALVAEIAAEYSGIADLGSYVRQNSWRSDNAITLLLAQISLGATDCYGWFTTRSLALNLSLYLMTWDGLSVWQPQMTFHLWVSLACFCISWLVFERCTAAAMAGTEGAKKKTRSKETRCRTARPGIADALVWKSWHHLTGGWRWFWLRLVGLPVLCTLIYVFASWSVDEQVTAEGLAIILMIVGAIAALLNLARLFGLVLNQELRENTLNGLLMLPRTRHRIVGALLGGLIPATVSVSSCFVLGLELQIWNEGLLDLADLLEEPGFWHCFTWAVVTLILGLALSVRLRYGGLIIAIAVCWVLGPAMIGFCMALCWELTQIQPDEESIFLVLMMIEIGLCFFFWKMLIAALERRGAEES